MTVNQSLGKYTVKPHEVLSHPWMQGGCGKTNMGVKISDPMPGLGEQGLAAE
jgi:hypothetical protein